MGQYDRHVFVGTSVPGANKIDVEKKAADPDHVPAPVAPGGGPAWKRACRVEDVPAKGMKEFPVDGTNVLIVHAGEAFVAYQAMCPRTRPCRSPTVCTMAAC